MSTQVPATTAGETAPRLVVLAGALVVLGQIVVILSFAAGWFLVSPSLTDEEIANGEGGFQFSYVVGWAHDSAAYALLIALIGIVVAWLWSSRARLRPSVSWAAFAGLLLVIPAQQTVLGSIFN